MPGTTAKTILICGPTASGKSQLAMALAERHGGIVVNADAMQVYSCWRILTARPTPKDMARVEHSLYGHVDKSVRYSVGKWLADFQGIRAANPERPLMVVGGTGLYFNALLNGLAPVPEVLSSVRDEAARIMESEGLARLAGELGQLDPVTARETDLSNPARVVRAWEVLKSTGHGLVHWQGRATPPVLFGETVDKRLVWPTPEATAARIRMRLDRMVSEGVVEECRTSLGDWNPGLPYSKALGAREFREYLEGKFGLEETLDRVAQATRAYAKRQRTWFRSRMADWARIEPIPTTL